MPTTITTSATDAHRLLIACPDPAKVLREFGKAVASGEISGTATVVYNRPTGKHEGAGAKLRPYWNRITSAAQEATLWSAAEVHLPKVGANEAVELKDVQFLTDELDRFLAERRPPKPKRGKVRNQDEWALFWLEAIKLAKRGLLTEGYYTSQSALNRGISEKLASPKDFDTYKPFVQRIWTEVVERDEDELAAQGRED